MYIVIKSCYNWKNIDKKIRKEAKMKDFFKEYFNLSDKLENLNYLKETEKDGKILIYLKLYGLISLGIVMLTFFFNLFYTLPTFLSLGDVGGISLMDGMEENSLSSWSIFFNGELGLAVLEKARAIDLITDINYYVGWVLGWLSFLMCLFIRKFKKEYSSYTGNISELGAFVFLMPLCLLIFIVYVFRDEAENSKMWFNDIEAYSQQGQEIISQFARLDFYLFMSVVFTFILSIFGMLLCTSLKKDNLMNVKIIKGKTKAKTIKTEIKETELKIKNCKQRMMKDPDFLPAVEYTDKKNLLNSQRKKIEDLVDSKINSLTNKEKRAILLSAALNNENSKIIINE